MAGREIKLDLSRRRVYANALCVTVGMIVLMTRQQTFWFGLVGLVYFLQLVVLEIKIGGVILRKGEIEIRTRFGGIKKVQMDEIIRVFIRQGSVGKILHIKSIIVNMKYEPNNWDFWWRMGFTSGAWGYKRNRTQRGEHLLLYKDFLAIPGIPESRADEYLDELDRLAGRKIERVDLKTGYPLQWDSKHKRMGW